MQQIKILQFKPNYSYKVRESRANNVREVCSSSTYSGAVHPSGQIIVKQWVENVDRRGKRALTNYLPLNLEKYRMVILFRTKNFLKRFLSIVFIAPTEFRCNGFLFLPLRVLNSFLNLRRGIVPASREESLVDCEFKRPLELLNAAVLVFTSDDRALPEVTCRSNSRHKILVDKLPHFKTYLT